MPFNYGDEWLRESDLKMSDPILLTLRSNHLSSLSSAIPLSEEFGELRHMSPLLQVVQISINGRQKRSKEGTNGGTKR